MTRSNSAAPTRPLLSIFRNLGFSLVSDTPLEYPARLAYTKIFQPRAYQIDLWTRQLIKEHCCSNSVCVDIGAYRGDILRFFLRAAVDGQVIGFEPNPINCRYLKRRFPASQIEQVALGDRHGPEIFLRDKDRPARSRLAAVDSTGQMANRAKEHIEVLVTTLDTYFNKDAHVDFVKIDAEGGELEILKGGIQVLSKNKPFMIIEHGLSSSPSAEAQSLEIFHVVNQEIGLEIYPLDQLRRTISNSSEFLNLLRSGSDYFFAAPRM